MTLPDWAARGRDGWTNTGRERPEFAEQPADGQESVWDYPRPPVAVPEEREIVVRHGEIEIARTRSAIRVLETASAPTFYLPLSDVDGSRLEPVGRGSLCEWKGAAGYFDVVLPSQRLERVAWFYPEPFEDFSMIARHIAFYPHDLECTLDGVRVQPQPGRFYAGWVTPEILGPFKGAPGTEGW